MRCPYCSHLDSRVVDSRDIEGGIRRRRECLKCKARFTTYERIEAQSLFVIKKDGRREPFDRNKLMRGIRKACEKRPLPTGTVERMVDGIEAKLFETGRAEIPTRIIGEMVMERLRELDDIAYIRFASVYRSFADLEDVRREMERLTGRPVAPPANQLPLITEEPEAPRRGRRGRRG